MPDFRFPALRSAARRCASDFGLRLGHERRAHARPNVEKVDWAHRRVQLSRCSPGAHCGRGVHVAVAMGGDRNAAILFMIAANNCREIATSAIWNAT